MPNIQAPGQINPEEREDKSPHRGMRLTVVVVNCPQCGQSARFAGRTRDIVPGQERDSEGRHRRETHSWVDLVTLVLCRRSMTLRLALLLMVIALPTAAAAAAIALIRNFGFI
jgi:hypothetical protein